MTYECKFCKKSFTNESTLVAHLCEPKEDGTTGKIQTCNWL